jgi:uncharacterized membrane protein YgcG
MNSRNKLGTGIAATLVALVAGCGGGGGKPLTVDDFCGQKAEKECLVPVVSCVSDADACKVTRKKACKDWAAAVTAADAKRTFTVANVSACVSKAGSVYALDKIKPSDLAGLDDTCEYVFQGTVAALSECTTKYDCKEKNNICDKGNCAPKMTVGKDAQCANLGAVCGAGQYCAMSGATFKCTDKIGSGEACAATTPCLETLRCSAAKCANLVMAGESCASDADCPVAAPYCDPFAGNLCTPGLKFATHSGSCAPFGDTMAAAIPDGGAAGSTGTAGSGGASGTGGAGGSGGSTGTAGADGSAGADGATASDAGDAGDAAGLDAPGLDVGITG